LIALEGVERHLEVVSEGHRHPFHHSLLLHLSS